MEISVCQGVNNHGFNLLKEMFCGLTSLRVKPHVNSTMSLLECAVLYVQDSVLNNMEKKVITITLM